MKDEIILFETEDKSITLPVQVTADTVWLNRSQLAELFGRDIKTIGKHIGNALKEELEESEVVAKFSTTTRHGAMEGKTQTHLTEYYNLDMIISVGYRVKSKRVAVKTEPYPGRWTHHIVIGKPEELDEELLSWIRGAYDFAEAK